MRKKKPIGFFTFALLFTLAFFSIGNWFERYQTAPVLFSYVTAFTGYLFLTYERESPVLLFALGIIARLTLFFSLPSLSDDIYRFIWDGALLKNGIHPFAELPGYYLNRNIPGLDQALYERLNSPEYFSIYPPLNQLIFWLSVQFNSNWMVSANLMRTLILAADIGSFLILKKLLRLYQKEEHLAFFYFLNPLVILESVGNIHFEGVVIFFLLGGLYLYEKNRKWFSAVFTGLAIGTKLLPAIYLPSLFFKGLKNKKWWIPLLSGVVGLMSILPIADQEFLGGMRSSLNLYFRRFEFNASLYFLARELGIEYYGYNNIAKIGPLLSVLSVLFILALSIIGTVRKWNIAKMFLVILSAYLFFTTTVHPWYILPLIAFGVLSGYWYPVVWSVTIFFTYAGYTSDGFELPLWIVVLEYFFVILTFTIEQFFKSKPVYE
ncbi:MAG: glycosyltransferase 87 family protein [Ekhidna sp.]|nr:glycosyltransferase 87 family protein [Ekhidna sp.]